MKWFKGIIIGLLALYAVVCIVVYFMQDKIFFMPDQLPENHRFRQGEEIELEVEKGMYIHCLLLKEKPSNGLIIYFHGNKGSNKRCLHQAYGLMGNGYDVLMPDYRGYGKSDGKIVSEKQLFSDADKVYEYALEHYEESDIFLVGYSMGTGMATHLAAKNNPVHVFLNSPYESFINLKDRKMPFIPDFLIKYPLNNKKHLEEIQCKVTLFHGTDDELIPYDSSVNLQKVNPDDIELIPMAHTSHRRAIFSDVFISEISRVLATF